MPRTPAYSVCFKMYIKVTLILIGTCRTDNSGIFPWHLICPKQINTANGKISWYGKPINVRIKYKESDTTHIPYFIN